MEGTAGLWLAVVASGLYHGVNPGMGWPLAVSAALMERRAGALWRALAALAAGHLAATLAILMPFAALSLLIEWQVEIRVGAAVLVIALGAWILVTKRHPRFLARVPPSRLALWSFLVALAHGAALMLVPIYLGLCRAGADAGHAAAGDLMGGNLGIAAVVAVVHSAAMLSAGGALAWAVHRWLGLGFLTRSWFDLERVWAASLILVGLIALATAGHR
ncbi:hypothetical protein M1105_04065 [Limibaculum sp. FT325]|uniref:hypothetical protein n=1 Tax=Thermohalobaculum sediminis TaxID=2939436 RepID=UPI0020C15790|nr:hypothetical protein [Limibaculum sediminis]MCL5776164.1 hypothetical protein [Limibaculum sediminis]